MTSAAPTARHRADLDGLRGIAIVGVLGFHAGLIPGGDNGVVVFFVLSGYLITTLLLREHDRAGRLSFRRFYLRRAVRLGPALLLALIGYVALSSRLGDHGSTVVGNVASALFYYRDLLTAYVTHADGTLGWAWSLSLEEQFYLVWPVLLGMALWKHRTALAAVLAGAGVVIATLIRFLTAPPQSWWLANPHGVGWLAHVYNGPDARMDALFAGCLLAMALHTWPRRIGAVAGTALGAAGLALVGTSYGIPRWYLTSSYTIWISLAAVGALACLASAVMAPGNLLSRLMAFPPLVWLGLISYGLYVWNSTFLLYVQRRLPAVSLHRRDALWLAMTLIVATASYRFVERPLLDRVAARRRSQLGTDPVGVPSTAQPVLSG